MKTGRVEVPIGRRQPSPHTGTRIPSFEDILVPSRISENYLAMCGMSVFVDFPLLLPV
jgi:hypothetical protein